MNELAIYTDGASKGNPGPAAIGVVIADQSGTVIREVGEYVGEATNNAAEYLALIRGLWEALDLGCDSIRINVDSELMARQISGVYKVKSSNLKPLHEKAITLLSRFRRVLISHVPRELNERADELANQAIKDQRRAKTTQQSTQKKNAKSRKQNELGL
ncbi:MAG: ribonuclease HI family protein [Armatimonadetes bacterium]|nr:ribonuclease HI family protein [Armatimonadota bacterium]